jgi:pyruvate,water dikinase
MREMLVAAALPDVTTRAIDRGLERLPNAQSFAVRSSATIVTGSRTLGEDGSEVSLAGQFDSVLAVPREDVGPAVKQCWASLFNDRSLARFGLDAAYARYSSMSVLVQEFVVAKACFVMMTVDPLGAGDTGALECGWGACEGLVSGAITPDEIIFERASSAIRDIRFGPKEERFGHLRHHPLGMPALRFPTHPAEQEVLSLDLATVRQAIALGAQIEQLFGCPQDIEAVLDPSGVIVVTQTRPVTTLPSRVAPFPTPLMETWS